MEIYIKIIDVINRSCGQEFVTQLLTMFLVFIGLPKRKNFTLKYLLSVAVIIGAGWFFSKVVLIVPYEYLIFFALIVFAIFFCFEENLLQSLFIGVIVYSLQHFLSCVTYAATLVFTLGCTSPESFYGTFFSVYHIVLPIFTAVVAVLAYILIARQLRREKDLQFNNAILIFGGTAFIIVAVFITHYAQKQSGWMLELQIYIRVLSALLSTMAVALLMSNKKNTRLQNENQVLQLLITKDRQQYQLSKRAGEKIQMKYHDIMKRTNAQGIVDYEELSEMDGDKEVLFSMYYTGNHALDIVLGEKCLQCEREGIRLICTADGTAIDFMKSYHIYSLIGNALDNAIESLTGSTRAEVKEIELSITKQRNMCVITISNYAENVNFGSDGLPLTTKKDAATHGYGVKSMKNVVESYGGEISITFKDNVFTVKAVIPM